MLFFLSNPVLFNRQNYQKQRGSGTSDQSLFRLWNKFWKISLLAMYYLTKFDDEIESDIWVILKITSANLCKPIYDIISYSTSIRCFESGKCGKEGKKLQKWDISREWKELFRSNKKTFFIVFEGLLFNEKIKIWKK